MIRTYIALCILSLALYAGCSTLSHDENRHEDSFKAMTLNIRYDCETCRGPSWSSRSFALQTMIEEHDFDIAAFQELYTVSSDGTEYLYPEQLSWFIERFGDRYHVVNNRFDLCPENPETLLMLVKKSRYDVLKTEAGTLSTPDDYDGLPRLYISATVRDRETGEQMLLINTHFDLGPGLDKHRQECASQIESLIVPDEKVIQFGDFNSRRYDALFPELMSVKITGGTFHGYTGIPLVQIDSILYQNISEVYSAVDRKRYDGQFFSDHYPIIALFRY